MGFQVQEWASEKSQRASEGSYLVRLHSEVVQLTQDRARLVENIRKNQLRLSNAVAVLHNRSDRQVLTEQECAAIHESHIYSNPTANLPTVNELLSSGRLDTLQAKGVKSAITQLNQSALVGGDFIDAVNRNILILAREFPMLIRLETVDADTPLGIRTAARCDATTMKANPQFMNTFVDNRDRYAHYAVFAVEPVTESLVRLHAALDAELGIVHTEEEAKP